jgi:hypothetical protein
MVDDATFLRVVCSTVGEMLEPFGYELRRTEEFRVRFERLSSFVEVAYDGQRSHEASIWLSEIPAAPEPPLELADVLRTTTCVEEEIRTVEVIQTSDSAALSRLLTQAAELLLRSASLFLEGRPDEFAAARTIRGRRAAAYTEELRHRGVVDAANAAWERGEYGRVHDLLNPIRDSLPEPHRRRLKFAEQNL